MNANAVPAETPLPKLDESLHRVKDHAGEFARLSIDERIGLIERLRSGYREIAEQSVRAACEAKGIDFESAVSGEEWLAGPMVTLRNLRLLGDSLRDIKRYGAPRIDPSWVRTLPDGQLSVKVYPSNLIDRTLVAQTVGEVRMQPGVTAQNLSEHQASFYRKPHEGRLCLVLGAGNVNSIPPMDCLYKMFVEGAVVVLKMNPVNAYLGPLLERAFQAAIERGFLAVVYGGAEEGGHLINHPLVDEVHMTGSDVTYELMVWGPPGAEREERKKKDLPLLAKPISAELGSITPVIVVPGPYSESELRYQAANIAGMVCNNASFNCTAAKLLVSSGSWSGREHLLELLSAALERGGVRKAFYPGSEQRWRRLIEGRKNVELIGAASEGRLPIALIKGLSPTAENESFLRQEPWCAAFSEVVLAPQDPGTYLAEAVRFVNQRVWGTLSCHVIIHPKTAAEHVGVLEKALKELRYGAVCLNTWAGAVYGLGTTPWGGYPGSTRQDIQSGQGWVHNTYMLEDIEKSVLYSPLTALPIWPWLPGHRSLKELSRRLVDLETEPSLLKLPGIALAALRA